MRGSGLIGRDIEGGSQEERDNRQMAFESYHSSSRDPWATKLFQTRSMRFSFATISYKSPSVQGVCETRWHARRFMRPG